MKPFKPEKKVILNLVFLSIILLVPTFILITPKYKVFSINNIIEEPQIKANQPNLANNQINVSSWDDLILKFDRNDNRIDDKFDSKLNSIMNSDSEIRLIIQFPDIYDYSNALTSFENYGGKVKYSYKYAINGFSGSINYKSFKQFYGLLKNEDIQFLINENSKVSANLYYTSRSMNTRPYVWNTLGYDGDNKSAIAILDTGIDESSEFFDNYTLGDYNYKIVGWRDFVGTVSIPANNLTAGVRDKNGHGSHCAGIAAGLGTPVLDSHGRIVTTSNDIYKLKPKDHGDSGGYIAARFNVTAPGDVSVLVNFTDLNGIDDTFGIAYLLHEDSGISAGSFISTNWWSNLTLTATADTLGEYEVIIELYYDDDNGDLKVTPNVAFRAECHYLFNPDPLGCGNYWKGVAPDAHLVGVKVMGDNGIGSSGDIIQGIEWVIQERTNLNITIMSLSFGGPSVSAEINAVDKAMRDYGIVTVVSAGNNGPGGNTVGSPGDADYVITVAAMNTKDQITIYSSQGGSSYYGNTIKPDITAPGGSAYDLQIISADSNDNDCEGQYTDSFVNDTKPAQGTSMAAPAVAGAASLLIEAMRKNGEWDWTSGSNSTLVKSLLLMTATETYPLQREYLTDYSPSLDRGGKDVHEGYGRINIDAAIEAWIFNLTNNVTNNEHIIANLKPSYSNSFAKHATAGFVNLKVGESYCFNLSVPSGYDYDMHLYNSTPASYGEPDLIWSRKSSVKGQDEFYNYTYNGKDDGKYFLVIKAIGPDLPGAVGDDDDDDNGDDDVQSLLEFLLSPLGLLLVVGIISIVVVLIVLIARREKEDYAYRPDYSY